MFVCLFFQSSCICTSSFWVQCRRCESELISGWLLVLVILKVFYTAIRALNTMEDFGSNNKSEPLVLYSVM